MFLCGSSLSENAFEKPGIPGTLYLDVGDHSPDMLLVNLDSRFIVPLWVVIIRICFSKTWNTGFLCGSSLSENAFEKPGIPGTWILCMCSLPGYEFCKPDYQVHGSFVGFYYQDMLSENMDNNSYASLHCQDMLLENMHILGPWFLCRCLLSGYAFGEPIGFNLSGYDLEYLDYQVYSSFVGLHCKNKHLENLGYQLYGSYLVLLYQDMPLGNLAYHVQCSYIELHYQGILLGNLDNQVQRSYVGFRHQDMFWTIWTTRFMVPV